ncbi:MAG: thiosulfate oxidation carrier protein SoxY [Gammaproteobacteria bacterium]|jgi:sulfur-oxidizing protein SoxY|nr:thiosulfate oxidation carrier protein SoxY [Gammaproteobacteria bacterium]MBT4074989.1 thiosulfate oxidation carrier protein SoxY [Gammaproteobacteria bacterium]MBT4196890.1 thiosulfate oxidation carrier protein SoxY [Gammaproteobacteria bacterium]MBT4862545.1 thiosulfate oxidation carrier protein SoxY [Gammaproteobacteria bacterium]MBT6454617.1 thiosulfate oxidation carrier protein SoxY [Gammaproteobacteria bacterium]
MNRRTLLKRTLAVSAVSVAASAGLLAPGQALAAYPTAAFEAKDSAAALSAALGSGSFEHSDDIKIKAPDIAENGSVVPVTISSSLAGVESISLLSESNNSPMVASFNLNGSQAFISTRIKMGKTGNVLAVVKSGGKLYANKKEVKVTIGGCGG